MKVKAKYIFLVLAAAALSALMMSCSSPTETHIEESSEISETAPQTSQTAATAQTSSTTEITAETSTEAATTTATTTLQSTSAPIETDALPPETEVTNPQTASAAPSANTPWEETPYSAQLYVNTECYSRARAEEGARALILYESNALVTVTALTDTGYYKLADGGYIHTDFLSDGHYIRFSTSTSISDAVAIPKQLPSSTAKEVTYYDPAKALAYAESNWYTDMGHCAAFVQACIGAGGVHGLSDIGATTLYNQLMASGLGYAIELTRDEDGYIIAPDYAFPGDILFYYCPVDKRMVHTVLYNGSTKDGYVKAYAHNPSDDGQEKLWYLDYCPDYCTGKLDTVALFCFYRNPATMKQPDTIPTINVRTEKSKAYFDCSADFVYGDSALVVLDNNGREVYRGKMGTDTEHSLIFYSTAEYTAYVEMYIGSNIVVKSDEVKFNVEEAAKKN